MKNNNLIPIIVYILFMFGMGVGIGCMIFEDKYKEQLYINNTLYNVIESHEKAYDELEVMMKKDLNSCYSLVESCQYAATNKCFVNGGWNCE